MTRACSGPSPNTVWVPVLYRSQARQPAAASRSAGRVSGLLAGAFNRETQHELAPFTRLRYRDDFALVKPGQLSHQVKAQPGAGHVVEPTQAAEAHEQPIHVLRRDPNALVAHAQHGHITRDRQLRRDIAAFRRVFDGIVQQVGDDDLEPQDVAEHPELTADAVVKTDSMPRGGGYFRGAYTSTDELAEIDALALQLHPSVLEPRCLHHLVGEEVDLGGFCSQHRQHRTQPL